MVELLADKIFLGFLTLHIIGGFIGLLTGTINLLNKKGNKKHQVTGKLFAYAMLVAGFSSIVLSILHQNYFLLMIGIFTLYLIGSGYRYIYLRMLGRNQKPAILDWSITIIMLLAGILFIVLGVNNLLIRNNFGILFIVFGLLGLRFVKIDLDNYKGKIKEINYWLLAHLQRMIAGYIAALTAFLVVNIKYLPFKLPSVLIWLLPTIILTPLIIYWSKKYKVRVKAYSDKKESN